MSQSDSIDCPRVAFQFDLFRGYPVVHGLSGRVPGTPGDGDIAYTEGAEPAGITQNRREFLAELGVGPGSLTLADQVHGSSVAAVRAADRGRGLPPSFDGFADTDGLVTTETGLALGVIVADCVPLVLYDPVHHALGVVHAGWRGTVAMIAARAIETMAEHFGTRPPDVLAGIGPSIGPCCYEVGDEVIAAWRSSGMDCADEAVRDGERRSHLDLWTANRLVLESAGLFREHIEAANVCVHCEAGKYFSHRAAVAGRAPRGRMMMVAGLSGDSGGDR